MNFIEQIANKIHSDELELQHLTIILPSERAKKYLTSELFKVYKKPIMSPNITTMDKWVKSFSPEVVIDKTRALVLLFRLYTECKEHFLNEDKVASFDEFLKWGNTLLADFNEIDRYLLDAKQVFRNLADIKEIENWSFNEEELAIQNKVLTKSQKRFMEFWDLLPGLYKRLNEELTKKETCYTGKAYRFLSNNIDVLFNEDKEHRFIFAGFNALSKAELTIIRQLDVMGRGEILINADEFYLKDPNHEAGSFLRTLSSFLDNKNLNFVENNLAKKSMDVELIECAQVTGQVKVACSILAESSEAEINETMLLLADESLISSILKNLPKSIGFANITLGLPVKNTALKTWAELIFSIQENKQRFKTNSVYHNDLKDFGNHPFLLAILDNKEKKLLIDVEKAIIRYNKIFINAENLEIGNKAKKLFSLLVEPWKDSNGIWNWELAIGNIRKMNRIIYGSLEKEFAFEKAIVEGFDHSLIEFENLVTEGLPTMNLNSFEQLFGQHWGMKSIAYHGNPLKGLQIMGLLETRALDFKRIICVGMNEGQLPPTNPIQTLIPMDLRAYLELPTPREKQGLFAHHFYRLLHKCEHLTVTYTSAQESIGSNEPSRYLMQLEMELGRINTSINIKKRVYSLVGENDNTPQEVVKTPEIISRMDELFKRSTSASMLKTFITCPLDYYYKYVMDFGDTESVEEEIESSTFGTFIHDTLEELYLPFARYRNGELVSPAPTNITSFDVQGMLKNYPPIIEKQFLKHFNNDRDAFMKGKNYLSFKMAMELTQRFLKAEIDFLSRQTELVFIESLEDQYSALIDVEVKGETKQVNLRGFIDRIDKVGDKIRIVDYKSGKVADTDVKFGVQFKGLDSEEEKIVHSIKGKKHLLQLIQYAFLYHQKNNVIAESSIISFISGNFVPFTLQAKNFDIEDIIVNYPKYLGLVMEEMYDQEIPFTHMSKGQFSYCQYCQ